MRRFPVLLAVGILALGGCTASDGAVPDASSAPPAVPASRAVVPDGPLVLSGADEVALALSASRAVWQGSPVVVTVAPDADEAVRTRAIASASDLRVPLLVVPASAAASAAPSDEPLTDPGADPSEAVNPVAVELARLGTTHVLHVGPGAPDLPDIRVVVDESELPAFAPAAPVVGLTALTAPRAAKGDSEQVALGSLAAAGARVLTLTSTDPRADSDDVELLEGLDPARAIGVGAGFGSPDTFAQRIEAAATGVQLPGGGQTIFDGKRYVALYGHPLTSALGVLGEQGPAGSVKRARAVAAQYEPYAEETIVPAFEIIATVAAGSAGEDGNYSNEWDVDVLRPLVDAAAESGIYVVLDLQSGRSDFPSQARLYEELLRQPHVGLALDPEWRLTPGQKPLAQIGSVDVAEINQTLDWLAELTDSHDLPQKMVLLHQFRTDMILGRQDLDLSHDELAVIVQMDGDGTLGQKLDTWRALLADAPDGLRFGWKNFYDEDEPTPSPATTFQVEPRPWWVSYQ